jgi:chaperonin cofactor prefoldin
MEKRVESLEKSIQPLAKEFVEIKDLITSGFPKVANNFDSIKKEIDSLHNKADIINLQVKSLEGSTNDGFGDVGLKLENLSDEISKIGVIAKYDEEYKNLQGLN